jgi:hypothetical protein
MSRRWAHAPADLLTRPVVVSPLSSVLGANPPVGVTGRQLGGSVVLSIAAAIFGAYLSRNLGVFA